MNPLGIYPLPVSVQHDEDKGYWEIKDKAGVLICICDTGSKAALIEAAFVAVMWEDTNA